MSNAERDTRENEVVANLAKQSVDRGHAVTPNPIDIHTFTITDGYGSEKVVTNSFEQYLPAPRRQRGTTTVTDTESFIQLVAAQTRRWSTPEQAVIFADVDQFNVTAILNFDDWKDHRVSLAMQRSPEWLLWKSLDNKLVTQSTFAQHLSDGRRSILSPDAATLMEIAQTFKAKRNVSYESGVRLQSGGISRCQPRSPQVLFHSGRHRSKTSDEDYDRDTDLRVPRRNHVVDQSTQTPEWRELDMPNQTARSCASMERSAPETTRSSRASCELETNRRQHHVRRVRKLTCIAVGSMRNLRL